MAEYEACILRIRISIDMNIKELLVIEDSDLLIHQVQGEWTTKNVMILMYLHYVKESCKKFTKIECKHIPRNQNVFFDALATLLSMIQHTNINYIYPIEIEVRDQHAYCFYVDEEPYRKPWYHNIKRLLEAREYQKGATNGQKQASRRLANNVFFNGDLIREIREKFKIAHRNSTTYRLQINGAVKVANKNTKRILRKIVDNNRQWHEKSSFSLLGNRTTLRKSTGKMPYMWYMAQKL
ncbi:uncharacterized protein [Nicotiana tomentosiformis]|uniref:uncharacterized protein n=1 Tax=Nicotiana tomentosiformis TaxID=4098 RepID=UPI00388CAE7B